MVQNECVFRLCQLAGHFLPGNLLTTSQLARDAPSNACLPADTSPISTVFVLSAPLCCVSSCHLRDRCFGMTPPQGRKSSIRKRRNNFPPLLCLSSLLEPFLNLLEGDAHSLVVSSSNKLGRTLHHHCTHGEEGAPHLIQSPQCVSESTTHTGRMGFLHGLLHGPSTSDCPPTASVSVKDPGTSSFMTNSGPSLCKSEPSPSSVLQIGCPTNWFWVEDLSTNVPRRPQSRRRFTRQPESPNVHMSGSRPSKTPPKFNERTPKREKKERKLWREKEKTERIFGRSCGGEVQLRES